MKTHKQFQKEKSRCMRQELKTIESYLHPLPEPLSGYQICHRHAGTTIIFTAWQGNHQANTKSLKFYRSQILNDRHFYSHHSDDFKWLVA